MFRLSLLRSLGSEFQKEMEMMCLKMETFTFFETAKKLKEDKRFDLGDSYEVHWREDGIVT